MFDKVKNIISEYTNVPSDKITGSSRLIGDLELTSLDIAEIIVRIEEEYNIIINERSIENISTVDDVVNKINSCITENK